MRTMLGGEGHGPRKKLREGQSGTSCVSRGDRMGGQPSPFPESLTAPGVSGGWKKSIARRPAEADEAMWSRKRWGAGEKPVPTPEGRQPPSRTGPPGHGWRASGTLKGRDGR